MTEEEKSLSFVSIDDMYRELISWELGQRLGVSYMQAQQDEISIHIHDEIISLQQSSLGVIAISGVVWDAGLLLVDFLVWICGNIRGNINIISSTIDSHKLYPYFFDIRPYNLGTTLDLGCGTGIAGVTAMVLNATSVTLSDYRNCCSDNIGAMNIDRRNRMNFVEYDWNHQLPNELRYSCKSRYESKSADGEDNDSKSIHRREDRLIWDTILCSDVVYERKASEPLLQVLSQLSFRRLIISYKRRHDEPEKIFFEKLSEFCDVTIIKAGDIPLVNLKVSATLGLYVVLAVKK